MGQLSVTEQNSLRQLIQMHMVQSLAQRNGDRPVTFQTVPAAELFQLLD